MNHTIFLYFIGALIASSFVRAWFETNMPVHLFQFLKYVGWKKKVEGFWPDEKTLKYWDRDGYMQWQAISLNSLLVDLLSCPICFSFHVSFWTSLLLILLFSISNPLQFIFICTFGWPTLIHGVNKLL